MERNERGAAHLEHCLEPRYRNAVVFECGWYADATVIAALLVVSQWCEVCSGRQQGGRTVRCEGQGNSLVGTHR